MKNDDNGLWVIDKHNILFLKITRKYVTTF